jgi:hypothetical protein
VSLPSSSERIIAYAIAHYDTSQYRPPVGPPYDDPPLGWQPAVLDVGVGYCLVNAAGNIVHYRVADWLVDPEGFWMNPGWLRYRGPFFETGGHLRMHFSDLIRAWYKDVYPDLVVVWYP